MKKDIQSKREKEKQVVGLMISLYCKKNHHTQNGLCPDCHQLKEYAEKRSDNCPFMETKTFCSNCKIHCYKADMRRKIKEVMKFSGPRMIFYHPVLAVSHLVESRKEKKRMERENG